MEKETAERISQAATEAADRVWNSSVIPKNVNSGGLQSAMSAVENQADAAYQKTVREMSAALGFEERDYYFADPLAAVIHEPDCMAERNEYSLDDLADVLNSEVDEDRLLDDHFRANDDLGQGFGY
ncbi:hypothetical protein [Amycolatopsis circi]|uniref:hypothetical protein n=1 Tax=Amycolatopsis circi TaxID=871959 RepID=UPI000E25F28B|nr:hypothetical protein [Amycolatopsis circi]